LGAFIEPTHAERQNASVTLEGAPNEERSPERSWPVELVALFPAGIGSIEQVFRAPVDAQLLPDADGGTFTLCLHDTPAGRRFAHPVRAEQSAAASIGVVAHPIHTHAPPAVL